MEGLKDGKASDLSPVAICRTLGMLRVVPIVTYRTKYTHLGKAKGRDDVSASL